MTKAKAILEFIEKNSTKIEDISKLIDQLESHFYSLVEQANQVEKTSPSQVQNLLNQVAIITKDFYNVKTTVMNSTNEQKEFLLNRIEDIQENLADFAFQFTRNQNLSQNSQKIQNTQIQLEQASNEIFSL